MLLQSWWCMRLDHQIQACSLQMCWLSNSIHMQLTLYSASHVSKTSKDYTFQRSISQMITISLEIRPHLIYHNCLINGQKRKFGWLLHLHPFFHIFGISYYFLLAVTTHCIYLSDTFLHSHAIPITTDSVLWVLSDQSNNCIVKRKVPLNFSVTAFYQLLYSVLCTHHTHSVRRNVGTKFLLYCFG